MDPLTPHRSRRPDIGFWTRLIRRVGDSVPTPFYLFAAEPVARQVGRLESLASPLPVRHWLSLKTQPLRPLLRWWRAQLRHVEVVSEFEFRAALAEGFEGGSILVNGPAKHRWLGNVGTRGLRVNFDSLTEVRALAPRAKRLGWHVGLRLLTSQEFDPGDPSWPTQFGLSPEEACESVRLLRRAGLDVETMHFHLRTNVASAGIYGAALKEAAAMCGRMGLAPAFVDLGGGFPPPHTRGPDGQGLDAAFEPRAMEEVLAMVPKLFPSAREVWMENGRFVTAGAGVLVVRVLDTKTRRGRRHLICDGGRTMNALVSNWEEHDLFTLPARRGAMVPTTVTGPTCMAFDQFARGPMPRSLGVGDRIVWMDAGAYHLQWETRFSHGLAAVMWSEGGAVETARKAETFAEWWPKE